ncbi:Peptidase family M50 [Natronoarchaeum philippinense]|uniref:Peptidase family M50 n=1 Tax=Natronoarchaeum philippinense TaxID=558529 RepID=A0A285P7N9_NATPI|nr:site-2 protease family protein [Natronoarchaeum philippinense]SNZ17223.1 Peptidase family M50 [Natronoarchaeum philippinense]
MSGPEWTDQGPPTSAFADTFYVYEVREDGDRIEYFGTPLLPRQRVLEELWPAFQKEGYELSYERKYGETVLVAEPADDGEVSDVPWTNIVLFLATVVSTLLVGAAWYQIDVTSGPLAVLRAWPFAAAVMGVFGVHEMGHYVMSRYHGVRASLPYFIPVPTLFGTMGAVIKMKGQMPDRKALFDIGVAGPLAGLAATFVVTIIGLQLEPVATVEPAARSGEAVLLRLNHPPLLDALAALTGQADQTNYHPVVVGGWLGMFITFLNMIPVGQLDGGHVSRAMFGEYQETLAAAVPGALIALGGYLHFVGDVSLNSVGIWFLWGAIALFMSLVGAVRPIDDSSLGRKRFAVGVVTFVLAGLCFTPVPIEMIG